jgi:hypothetical protein
MVCGPAEEGVWQIRLCCILKNLGSSDMMMVARVKWLGHAIWLNEEVISKQVLF